MTVRQNHYSVPAGLIGTLVDARIHADRIEILRAGAVVAAHPRASGRYQTTAKLDHYLALLRYKAGAFAGTLALAQERERGQWPACFDELWGLIEQRYGRSGAAAQMVDVQMLVREQGIDHVAGAVSSCIGAGAFEAAAVSLLARRAGCREAIPLQDLDAKMASVGSPPSTLDHHNELLTAGAR